jgi:hypothetical protein
VKLNILLFAFLLIGIGLNAKEKIVEKSGKKPKWVNSLQPDFIITMATDNSIENAKTKALAHVKEQIVLSVADNVKTKSEYSTSETTMNKNVSDFIENFKSTTTSGSGKTDYVQGISILKVKDFYWEKVFDKAKKTTYYNYHIKYPFSEGELNELILSYKKQDAELTQKLESALSTISGSTSIEEIIAAQSQLGTLRNSFVDLRQEKAINGINEAKSLLQNMGLKTLQQGSGKLVFELNYNGKTYQYGKMPKISSACATIENIKQEEYKILVDYKSDYCIEEDPENGIDVRYQFGTIRVDKKFRFNSSEGRVEIFLKGEILLDNTGNIELPVFSKYENEFEIIEVLIEFQGKQIQKAQLREQTSFSTRGMVKVLAKLPNPNISEIKGRASGTIVYRSTSTGQTGQYRFYRSSFSKI